MRIFFKKLDKITFFQIAKIKKPRNTSIACLSKLILQLILISFVIKINLCNKKSHAIQALPAYWSEKVPKMWTLEIQGIFCPSLRDLQLVLEIPGNLPINYDNLPIIYHLPIN